MSMDKNELLMFAAHEADSRPLRTTKVKVYNYKPSRPDGLTLTPRGTITLFLAPKGSAMLAGIKQALERKDDRDVQMAQRIEEVFKGRRRVAPSTAAEQLAAAPVIADFRCGCRTLATNLFVPEGLDIAVLPMPYNGGRISRSGFTLVEHYREDKRGDIEAIAVRHKPNLTRAEATAIKLIPSSQIELNVAPNGACCADVTFVAFVVFAIVTSLINPNPELSLSDEEVRRLGPGATARRLMDLRREIMGHEHH